MQSETYYNPAAVYIPLLIFLYNCLSYVYVKYTAYVLL